MDGMTATIFIAAGLIFAGIAIVGVGLEKAIDRLTDAVQRLGDDDGAQ